MIYVGIDNGVSGSVGCVTDGCLATFEKTPTKSELSYTKVKRNITRIDVNKLTASLFTLSKPIKVLIERPMVNPTRYVATLSAIRALEATLIALEKLELPYEYIDSKEWQKHMLPAGLKGVELKKASLDIGKRLFPHIDFKGFKDADGLLIAEYGRQVRK